MKNKKIVKYSNLKDVRANFSNVVKESASGEYMYVVSVRNEPKVVMIDKATADKYLPKYVFTEVKSKKKVGGNIMETLRIASANNPPSPDGKTENISGNIDKIVYGI